MAVTLIGRRLLHLPHRPTQSLIPKSTSTCSQHFPIQRFRVLSRSIRTAFGARHPPPSKPQSAPTPSQPSPGTPSIPIIQQSSTNAPTSNRPPVHYSPQSLIVKFSGPERIYQGPPIGTFVAASYGLSAFVIGYACNAFAIAAVPHEGIQAWVPLGTGTCAILMVAAAFYILESTFALVRRITVIPTQSNSFILEIEASKMLPWRTKTFRVPVSSVTLEKSLQMAALSTPPRPPRRPLVETHLLLKPWVWIGRGIADYAVQTRSVAVREHMIKLKVKKDRDYKLDIRGEAWKGAAGLDRLLSVDRVNVRNP